MSRRQQPKNYVKYSGLGLQLVAITFALVLLGNWLDGYLELENTFVLIAIFLSVFTVIYLLIKKLK